MFTARFWKDALERAAKSAAQAMLLYGGGDLALGAWSANWKSAVAIAGAAAGLSLLTSIVSLKVGDEDTASVVDLK